MILFSFHIILSIFLPGWSWLVVLYKNTETWCEREKSLNMIQYIQFYHRTWKMSKNLLCNRNKAKERIN